MISSKLEYPIFTFDREELISAGVVLSPETITKLIAENNVKEESYALFHYGRAKIDLFHFISQPPYNSIFSNQKMNDLVFKNLERVMLPLPVLDALYHFRRMDLYTYRHILMVSALSTLLVDQLVSDQNEKVKELIAGSTHDIGKLCVPVDILKKENPLTAAEFNALKHHTLAGYVLLSYYFHDARHFAARVARDHHERKDGTGYPRGIRITDPMIDIITISDIYDALIAQRPYRPESFENRTALEELTWQANSGKININVVKALIAVNRSNKPHYSECKISDERRGTAPTKNVYGITDSQDQ